MKKKKNYVLAILFIMAVFLLLLSCKSKTIYVPVESIKTEYKERYTRDSIYYYDSIFVKEKGDTILLEKYKYIYRDKFKTDTICKVDSIRVPFPVVKHINVNILHNWQIALMVLGGVLIGYLGYRIGRKLLFKFK